MWRNNFLNRSDTDRMLLLGSFKCFVRFNVMRFVAPYLNKYLFYRIVVYIDR